MENNKVVVVPEDVRDLMQRTWLDYQNRKDIINGLIDDHKFDDDASIIESPIFKAYEKKCQEAMVAYNAACDELTKAYVPGDIKNKTFTWNLDFDTCELTITVH